MINDFIKGKAQYDFSKKIRTGILLHRAIDIYTDEHEITKEIKRLYAPNYRLYSGPFTDITYDYFLANDKTVFPHNSDLELFAKKTYNDLKLFETSFPQKFAVIFPMMTTHNWLYNYKEDWAIKRSFRGLTLRSKFLNDYETAFNIFLENKKFIKPMYEEFFPLLKYFSNHKLNELLESDL